MYKDSDELISIQCMDGQSHVMQKAMKQHKLSKVGGCTTNYL